jgi:ribosomal protein S18 acetylase RimI-like enzyme
MEAIRDGIEPDERVRVGVPAIDAAAADLLTVRSYRRVRTSWDMTRRLDTEWPVADPPSDVSLRTFVPGQDERVFHEVWDRAFADHWDHLDMPFDSFTGAIYGADDWDPSLAVIAEVDGEPVGHCLTIEFATIGYVGSLGVLRPHRGRGVARALLARAFSDLAARGQTVVELTVDAQNPTGAVRLYEGMGMTIRRETHLYEDIPTG